jgi:predicted TIM-barrel fold metal-dependent hydrolase
LPVLIHVADPAAFFLPIDETNERWEELHRHPEWSFYGPQFPRREKLLADFLRVVERHPRTVFIGAHLASNSEDLATLGQWLDRYPNLVVEIASRIAELGRQPFTARRFLIQYQDRLLFGTDGPWPEERLRLYWRFLETEDEYFPYSERPFPPQGFWNIYGVNLPDEVLRKIYYENALRVLPGAREKLETQQQRPR